MSEIEQFELLVRAIAYRSEDIGRLKEHLDSIEHENADEIEIHILKNEIAKQTSEAEAHKSDVINMYLNTKKATQSLTTDPE